MVAVGEGREGFEWMKKYVTSIKNTRFCVYCGLLLECHNKEKQ